MGLVRKAARWAVDFWAHLNTFVKVAGTLTALIGIAVTFIQTYDAVTGYFETREAARDFRALADRQLESGDYAAAWASNAKALELRPHDDDTERQQIAIAKQWLQNARIGSGGGPSSFAQLVTPLEEVLTARAIKASGAERADIEAHIAWARFLRSRDSGRPPEIDAPIQAALRVDPENAVAHAVKGFWLVWSGGPLPDARQAFDNAIAATGGDTAFADRLVLSAWLNRARSKEDYALGAVEYASRLLRRGRPLGDSAAHTALLVACYEDGLRDHAYLGRLAGLLVPTDHVALLEILGQKADREDRRRTADALRAFFLERTGNRAEARRIYEAILAAEPTGGSLLHSFVTEGHNRLRQ